MSRDIKYIGMDVHKEATVIAVLNANGNLVMESIVETKAGSLLQFIHGLRGELHVTWEEGTWAAWLYDLLKPQVQVLVCDPRRNALLKEGNKSDKVDARKLADLLRTGMANCAGFLESDRIKTLDLPQDGCLLGCAKSIESAMKAGTNVDVRRACADFLAAASEFYSAPTSGVRVLAARPLRVREHSATELFGDYTPEAMLIRVWMRTAVRKQVTSFRTFLSTLCHEFCHHLDFQRFGFPDSWHTRGFYERTAVLYHHVRGTPPKRLFWAPVAGGRWRIDWPRTNRG